MLCSLHIKSYIHFIFFLYIKKKKMPTTRSLPLPLRRKSQNIHSFLISIAKTLDQESIVVEQYINMYQNGVVETIHFVPDANLHQKVDRWIQHFDSVTFDCELSRNILMIKANTPDSQHGEYWDRLLIISKQQKLLKEWLNIIKRL